MDRAVQVVSSVKMIRYLQKLKGRSLKELRKRSGSAIYAAAEAAGFDVVTGELPNDLNIRKDALKFLVPSAGDSSLEGASRIAGKLESETIIRTADRILNGRFDLLGYEALDFGTPVPDWHFDPVSGRRSPLVHWTRIDEIDAGSTGDKKVIWELNRHQYFVTLSQAYLLTKEQRYVDAVASHFDSWCSENPPKKGVNWLSSLELAYRSIAWIQTFGLLQGTEVFTGERRERLLKLLFVQARHIERFLSTYFAPNTHLTGEALGLYYIGTLLDTGGHSKRWRELGFKILCDHIFNHVRDDGSYAEQASHYARYTADLYSDLVLIRRREGLTVPDAMIERLRRLQIYLEALIRPDGSFIIFGDDDGGRYFAADPHSIREIGTTIARLSIVTGKPPSSGLINREHVARSLKWTVSESELDSFHRSQESTPTVFHNSFPDGGVFSIRSTTGTDSDHLIFHAGPHGFLNCGHAHADALSFELCVMGCQFFADPGTYVYTADPELRNLFRSSEYHSSLLVNGESTSVPAGPFSWKSAANTRLLRSESSGGRIVVSAETDGFERLGVTFRRTVKFEAGSQLSIVDDVTARSTKRFDFRFVLAPDVEPKLMGNSITLRTGAMERTLEVRCQWDIEGEDVLEEPVSAIKDTHFSPIYGKLMATKTLSIELRAEGRFQLRTTFSWA
ncbi:MAG: alginate lyase family protein [Acidobacteria bacterium]|nr:alginate lyase family protein [Acidobacteriota bacterium]